MTSNTQTVVAKKGLSKLVRPRFGPGMLLQHDDLEQLNVYTRDLSRLLFRSLFGCGVICGLVVRVPEPKCGKQVVTVEAGVALDCCGDPIHVPQAQEIVLDERCDPDIEGELWVVLCGTRKRCAPRTSMCAPDDDDGTSVCTREREGFEIRVLRDPPECACGWSGEGEEDEDPLDSDCNCVNPKLKAYKDHYGGICSCGCAECLDGDCDCILLARLEKSENGDGDSAWSADHRVRRFIRPVLMRDPQVAIELEAAQPVISPATPSTPSPSAPSPVSSSQSTVSTAGQSLAAQSTAQARRPSGSEGAQGRRARGRRQRATEAGAAGQATDTGTGDAR